MVETIKKILKLSDLNLYETIKISFFAFVLAILELLSIGILAIIISSCMSNAEKFQLLPVLWYGWKAYKCESSQ